MHVDILTPTKNIYSDEISSLTVPTPEGEITILPHHINLLTQVAPGELVVKSGTKTHYLGVTGGFVEVANGSITVLADYAIRSEEIEVEKALEAQKRAETLKKRMEENISQQDMAIAVSELRRSIMELHVANKRKRRATGI